MISPELVIALASCGIAIYAAILSRRANSKAQSAIDHSVPYVEYRRGYEGDKLIHYFHVAGLQSKGWRINKIDLLCGYSEVYVQIIDENAPSTSLNEPVTKLKKATWPIREECGIYLDNPTDNIELEVSITRGQKTIDPSSFVIKPIIK